MKKILLWGSLALVILLLVGVILLFCIRQDIWFRSTQRISAIFRSSDLEEVKIDTVTLPIDLIDNPSYLQSLINSEHPIPKDLDVELETIEAHLVSKEIVSSFTALKTAIKTQFDEELKIRSSYRTKEEQEQIYGSMSHDIAAQVGASEHQIGLSLDVYIEGHVGGAILKTKGGRFIHSNAHEYGFILRYPYGKSEITGISYEPWHIRYVGIPHAKIMYEEALTLEEYVLDFLSPNVYYKIDSYYISRQVPNDGVISIPKNVSKIEISSDNCGGFIITAEFD